MGFISKIAKTVVGVATGKAFGGPDLTAPAASLSSPASAARETLPTDAERRTTSEVVTGSEARQGAATLTTQARLGEEEKGRAKRKALGV
tara:strand:- start:3279 stop:3548 length:270 start_codon:yes stop_codon:yes gene_type:complete